MEDGSYLRISLSAIVVIFIGLRFINNLLKAAFISLGSISLLALTEKSRENNRLQAYLSPPHRLALAAQIFDKVSLVIVAGALLHLLPLPIPVWGYLVFIAYLGLFDAMVPTMTASRWSEGIITYLFPIMFPFYSCFWLVTKLTLDISNSMEGEENEEDEEDAPEDIAAFIKAGADEGIITEHESSLLKNVLLFDETIVREVMTPRTDMECVEMTQSKEEVFEVFKRTKFSRLPVYRGDIDHIEGILRFKDVMGIMDDDSQTLQSLVMEPVFVHDRRPLNELLQEMLMQRMQMAIVIDEYGGTNGLITLEDVVEELVGEIHDEHETPEEDWIVPLNNGSYLVDGRLLLEEFCDLFDVDVDHEDVDTLGGYIFYREGHIPQSGEKLEIGEVKAEIAKADDRRIYKLTITPPHPIVYSPTTNGYESKPLSA